MEHNTPWLIITNITINDLEDIHQLNSLPEVDYYNTLGCPKNKEETLALVTDRIACNEALPREKYILKMETKARQFIGMMGLNNDRPNYRKAEIWYKLHPSFWNNGFATEALNALLDFGFRELKLHRIEAGVATENKASIRVLEKCGFQREGHHRKILPIRGQWVDNFSYAILDTDQRTTSLNSY